LQSTSLRYKLFLFAVSPLALAHVVYRSFKDGGWRYCKQRLGLGYGCGRKYNQTDSRPIHFHCASVGEFITAKSLINAIHSEYADKNIVVTTNTPTAAGLVNKLKINNITHYYLPIDIGLFVNRFLRTIRPQYTIILETEIWPTYYAYCAKNSIPISIINARLSNKTTNANNLIKNEYARALQNVDLILARSQEDYDKYLQLGANSNNIKVVGNLKYSISSTHNNELACTTIKRPFFLAASTHENEEQQLSEHIELLKRKNYLLVLAPRYPDRCKQLVQQLSSNNYQVAIRSQHDVITDQTDVYLVDTFGELDTFFNEAALVFIGGSLIPRGGHNVLEPASFAKCVVVGPHTDNFSLETKEMLLANAIIQVKDNHQLGIELISLLKNDTKREQYGKNALQFVNQKSEVLNLYINHLRVLIEKNN